MELRFHCASRNAQQRGDFIVFVAFGRSCSTSACRAPGGSVAIACSRSIREIVIDGAVTAAALEITRIFVFHDTRVAPA
jgi:hypothetical protein